MPFVKHWPGREKPEPSRNSGMGMLPSASCKSF